MSKVLVTHPTKIISGNIHLNGSKSISNRVLIIRALSGKHFNIENLSTSKDSATMLKILEDQNNDTEFNAGHAGTTFRFLTAFFAFRQGSQKLTGSKRMLERPIGPLVEALNSIGANINYTGNEGYPPLEINEPSKETGGEVKIRGDVSSQFISALLLIGPYLDKGLKISIEGELVSKPYLMMTINLMKHFGADVRMNAEEIVVNRSKYLPQDFYVEGDWSSASYLFEMCALAKQADLSITGLSPISVQGDSRSFDYFSSLGIQARFQDSHLHLTKDLDFQHPEMLEFNLIEEPDLTQTLVCTCAGLGIASMYSGLKTLKIKETDRTAALSAELQKMHVFFTILPPHLSGDSGEEYYLLSEKVSDQPLDFEIETYDDHRMALAFAPLGLIRPITIQDPGVVVKSYPEYWTDLENLGFVLSFE